MARRKITDGLTLLKNGVYERKLTLKNGKRKAFRSKEPSEVWQKIESFQEKEEKGPFFEDVAKLYYADKIEFAKNGTARCYKAPYKHWISEFSGIRIANIEPSDIRMSFNSFAVKGYCRKTVTNYKIVLKGIFDAWITTGEWNGNANPVTLVEIPRNLKVTEREPPTLKQIEKVKKAIKENSSDVGAVTAATYMYTGVRRGEGLALRFCDIDFEKEIITVNKQVEHVNNKPNIIDTKTKAGIRQVPLLKPYKEILQKLDYKPYSYVIGFEDNPLTQTEYNTRWINFCRKLGMAHSYIANEKKVRDGKKTIIKRTVWKADVTAHQFRHEFCTIMYEAGVPEEVAVRIMGHVDSKMIHRVYLHIREKSICDATLKLNCFLDVGTE